MSTENPHFALIIRLAREQRLTAAQEDEMTRMAQRGRSAPDLAQYALENSRIPKPMRIPEMPASYSANDAKEVDWTEDAPRNDFASFGNTEVPLPPVR